MKRQAQPVAKNASDTKTTKVVGDNQSNKRVLRSIVIKAVGEEDSKSIMEDPFAGVQGVLSPPYPQLELTMLKENSTELRQCIDAMATNIDSFGYRLVDRNIDATEDDSDDAKIFKEYSMLKTFLDNVNFEDDITSLRKDTRSELEECGNAYWEFINYANKSGLSSIERIPAHTIRLIALDNEATKVEMPYFNTFTKTIEYKTIKKRFRRYLQMVGSAKVFFKEWGDPRNISCKTGEIIPDSELTDRSQLANPLYHFKIKSNRSAYGIPRYIGNLFSIYGSRSAEEINFVTFQNNNIPSMIVMVSNGQLTDGSIKRVEEFVEQKIKGESNRSSFLIIEAEPADETQINPGTMKMDIKDLSGVQTEDQLFQEYDKNNSEKIRRAWRLPPIFVGKSNDYNRSCYSEDTETLTENGWKKYHEIHECERIATFNPNTGAIEYHEPVGGLMLYDYDGEMYHFNSQQLDILVTPDHDMWLSHVNADEFKKVKSQDVADHSTYFKFRNAAVNTEHKVLKVVIPEMVLADGPNAGIRPEVEIDPYIWVEFVASFVADGSTTPEFVNGKKRCMYNIQFSSCKERKIAMFRSIMDRMKQYGFNVCQEFTNKYGMTNFIIIDKVLWSIMRLEFGVHASNKKLGSVMTMLNEDLSNVIIRTLQNTDGTIDLRPGRTNWSYSSTSKLLVDQLQTILIHNGHRANIICDDRNCYRVLVTPDKDTTTCRDTNISTLHYRGKVYCFNVPNHLFITRRNGKVSIQGNTAQESRKLADEQVFGPERKEFDRIMNKILMTEFKMVHHTFTSNSANVTNDEDLVKILSNSEKTGGVTPNLARAILSDVLNRELPQYNKDEIEFDPDIPMSLTMVEMARGTGGNGDSGVLAPNQGQIPKDDDAPDDEVVKSVLGSLRKVLYKDIYNEIVYEV